jgi:hypothetical protein
MYCESNGMSKLITSEFLEETTMAPFIPCEGSHDVFINLIVFYRVVGDGIGLRGNIESRIAAL